MRFTVAGAWSYEVRVVRDLRDEQGRELMGRAIQDSHLILIDSKVEMASRMNVLLHELRHAWQFHVPAPRDAEEECNLSATFTAAFRNDFEAAGGYRALLALSAEEDRRKAGDAIAVHRHVQETGGPRYVAVDQVERVDCVAMARGGRASCGVCDTLLSDAGIVMSRPRIDPVAKGRVATRMAYCPHCEHLMTWDEAIGFHQEPTGAVVRGPFYCTDSGVVEKFLKENPQAAGVMVGA